MKKTSFYLLLLNLLFFSFNTNAQNFALGIRGGMSIPNLTAGSDQTPLSTGYSSRLGADGGIFAEFKFSNLFSLQPMIEYSDQGGKKDGVQAFPLPAAYSAYSSLFPSGYLYANYNSVAKLNYLMLPVLAKFGWNLCSSRFRIYVDAGPFVSYLISAHQVTSGESLIYSSPSETQPLPAPAQSFNATTDIRDQLYTVNMGIEGNLGISYKLCRGNIFIEGGGNYGFLNIQKNPQDGKNNTGAGTVAVGYEYWF